MKTFIIIGDANGVSSFAIPFGDYIDVRVLLPNIAETVTIPTGAKIVVFSSAEDFYVCTTATAAVPTTDITNGTGSELNPVARIVENVPSFSMIAPYNAIVTMNFYS
jgi:hypothetical protein